MAASTAHPPAGSQRCQSHRPARHGLRYNAPCRWHRPPRSSQPRLQKPRTPRECDHHRSPPRPGPHRSPTWPRASSAQSKTATDRPRLSTPPEAYQDSVSTHSAREWQSGPTSGRFQINRRGVRDKEGIGIGILPIGQRCQIIKANDSPTSTRQNRMTRRRIPLHRATQTRVQVRLARRDKAELKGRSRAFHILDGIFVDVVIRRLIPVGFGGHDHQRAIVTVGHIHRGQITHNVFVKGTGFLDRLPISLSKEHAAFGRSIDNTAGRYAALYHRNVHSKVAATMHKLLGAIQRINNQKRVARGGVGGRLFLGHQHHIGKGRAKPLRNNRIRRLIRRRNRAVIRLGFNVKIILAVNFHNLVTSFQGQLADHRDQRVIVH
mmetsp:Transcript_17998/g.27406  ORF Transcript_17998/g.27406 Transcript_17998/m.27406 type:complete len:378 (+) Transcript_17998:14954-16087(+)